MKSTRPRKKAQGKITSKDIALKAAEAARDMKAEDIVVLEVAELVGYTDFFVIASGRSTRQAQSIAENIRKASAKMGVKLIGAEGEREGNWILMDCGQVVAHVFYRPVRDFYELEKLFAKVSQLPLPWDD
jgi:ribosome-associated protein